MEEEQNTSPVAESTPQEHLLTFPMAIAAVGVGKAIGKVEWDKKERGYSAKLIDGKVKLCKPDGVNYDWVLSDGDLAGEDYYII